jgi:hypothetical protein
MPQINRIRVNNVKYNFGTQVYDDFMMRFNCSNTIYDLANGGGKSLLMLLLLQNVIPNCTLDEKQPIEKLFRAGGGNTVIHSLIEWKLDACYQKDNFKYMTTGFCARKGRDTEDLDGATEALDGKGVPEAQAKGSAARDNASVEYFNYCIFYREFGDNDIKNLPLQSNGERITYNGLKAYLRELEKNDFNVSVKIFERKGDYLNFITGYGLFESEWEIVRGINKTEGHVRTYFESNYKTSRKVVEDLLIEEIIQKSFNNRLAVDNDEGKMAQTLLDIKDKLLELSKKHAQMSSFDQQISAMDQFAEYVESFREMYVKKEELEKTLYQTLLACKKTALVQDKKIEELSALIEKMKQEQINEQRFIQTAEVIGEQNSLKSLTELIHINADAIEGKNKEYEAQCEQLIRMESANDYEEYCQYRLALKEITETLDNRMRGHDDITHELQCMARVFYKYMDATIKELSQKCDVAEKNVSDCEKRLQNERERYRNADKESAAKESLAAFTKQQIVEEEAALAKFMEDAGVVVAEDAASKVEDYVETIQEKEQELCKAKEKYDIAAQRLEECKETLMERKADLKVLSQQLEKQSQLTEGFKADGEHLGKLQSIYGEGDLEQLKNATLSTYRKLDQEYQAISTALKNQEEFIKNAQEGTYICKDPQRDRLADYLNAHYKEDVVEGHEWFRNLSAGQKRDVFKRAPFIEYAFVIKNDFERIRQDRTLDNFEHGAYAIPIVSEQILYDTKLEVNKELVTFAMKDMAFLRDDARLEAEIKAANEEVEALKIKLEKAEDKRQVVWDDYTFIQQSIMMAKYNDRDDNEKISAKIQDLETQCNELESKKEYCVKAVEEVRQEVGKLSEQLEEMKQQKLLLSRVAQMSQSIDKKYSSLNAYREDANQAALNMNQFGEHVKAAEAEKERANRQYSLAKEKVEKLEQDWNDNYRSFYREDMAEDEMSHTVEGLSHDELRARFLGLKAVLDKETLDVSDKQALAEQYRRSMEKCQKSIEYRGMDFETIERLVKDGTLHACSQQELKEYKKKLNEYKLEMKESKDELDAQNALMNRLEGSIAHGINQIEEKFGAYEPFACDNPDNFIKQHKGLVAKLSQNMKEVQERVSKAQKLSRNIAVMEKDLERIVESAGMKAPEEVSETDDIDMNIDIQSYGAVQKEYDSLIKRVFKKRDEFLRNRQKLEETLIAQNAQDLAREIRVSIRVPENVSQTISLKDNLKETNTFIQLEKDRIAKGIEDMERIKQNFENRCIQTCCNIKTELDRLPKLSNITLDDELISIISLGIPYVKEDQYKERMSAYIDETIVMAESFKEVEERLRYIRNRLTWKRLFSVIVTDMNAIRINLYKRERIKEQSRYLRYEEAVGSTGQSQGIYIQFLIAIINYISNINASSKETALIGKTIFIDNPFGAAKDIYIWEPIFKLLQTNHVQLIVPARGATPAITGRFEVNYILGQKLVGQRQQTVVTDYYSRTKESELEYTKMDYEQATFDFI